MTGIGAAREKWEKWEKCPAGIQGACERARGRGFVKSALDMAKPPLSLSVSASCVFGFVLFDPSPPLWPLVLSALGVFLLACGAATLNNVQDRREDARFERTRKRALPAGDVSAVRALAQAVLLMTAGLAALWGLSGGLALGGAGAAACYNGIYTPLKKKTRLAVFPGTVCGMLPPLMGWMAAGGDPFSPEIGAVMAILGIWQVPHSRLAVADWLDSNALGWIVLFAASLVFWGENAFDLTGLSRGLLALDAGLCVAASAYFLFLSVKPNRHKAVFHYLNMALPLGMLVLLAAKWGRI
ncbi:putative Protoheme IX farnesyltransferase [Candidatus Desulfarcum epimagneticum]|uniref:heme o synthase n=1 Tax=uncultured Desulfobacteraceae bacterium TaxID=218296 RepID=A0A484HGC8_9BACT|nr:putative Protoheme IX farnesyltransferase [uncultured Desulfobacteraceae bacterium]